MAKFIRCAEQDSSSGSGEIGQYLLEQVLQSDELFPDKDYLAVLTPTLLVRNGVKRYDAILLGPHGITVLEGKNWTGHVRPGGGKWIGTGGHEYGNPIQQLEKQECGVMDYLRLNLRKLPTDHPARKALYVVDRDEVRVQVVGFVVFTNADVDLSDVMGFNASRVVRLADLNHRFLRRTRSLQDNKVALSPEAVRFVADVICSELDVGAFQRFGYRQAAKVGVKQVVDLDPTLRTEDLRALAELVRANPVVVVTGLPGVGKGSLVSLFLRGTDSMTPPPLVGEHDCSSYRSLRLMIESIAAEVGLDPQLAGHPKRFLDVMATHGGLFVFLNNFEELLDSDGIIRDSTLSSFLQLATQSSLQSKIIISCQREPLLQRGSRFLPFYDLSGLTRPAASRFTRTRWPEISEDLAEAMYERTAGNPQATIFLAALLASEPDHLRMESLEELSHRSLTSLYHTLLEQLDDPERTVLEALVVSAGRISRSVVYEYCNRRELTNGQVTVALRALLGRRLVLEAGDARLQLSQQVLKFVAAAMKGRPRLHSIMAESLVSVHGASDESLPEFDLAMRTAFHAASGDDPQLLAQLLLGETGFLFTCKFRGNSAFALDIIDLAMSVFSGTLGPEIRTRLAAWRIIFLVDLSDLDQAVTGLSQVEKSSSSSNDLESSALLALCRASVALATSTKSQERDSRALCKEAVAFASRSGFVRLALEASSLLASRMERSGDIVGAWRTHHRAAKIAVSRGYKELAIRHEATAAVMAARMIRRPKEDHSVAIETLRSSLRSCESIGAIGLIGRLHAAIADLYQRLGDWESCERHRQSAIGHFGLVNKPTGLLFSYSGQYRDVCARLRNASFEERPELVLRALEIHRRRVAICKDLTDPRLAIYCELDFLYLAGRYGVLDFDSTATPVERLLNVINRCISLGLPDLAVRAVQLLDGIPYGTEGWRLRARARCEGVRVYRLVNDERRVIVHMDRLAQLLMKHKRNADACRVARLCMVEAKRAGPSGVCHSPNILLKFNESMKEASNGEAPDMQYRSAGEAVISSILDETAADLLSSCRQVK